METARRRTVALSPVGCQPTLAPRPAGLAFSAACFLHIPRAPSGTSRGISMGSGPNRVGQIGWLLLLVTLLQGSSAWAQGTVCHRVWVEVRDNDPDGELGDDRAPAHSLPGRSSASSSTTGGRRASRWSRTTRARGPSHRWCSAGAGGTPARNPGVPSASPHRTTTRTSSAAGTTSCTSAPYANGERHYGATITNLTGKITLSWSATLEPARPPAGRGAIGARHADRERAGDARPVPPAAARPAVAALRIRAGVRGCGRPCFIGGDELPRMQHLPATTPRSHSWGAWHPACCTAALP